MRNAIKEMRGEHQWTQSELADRLAVSRQTINSLEKGRYDPSLPLAFRISRVLERPIEQIFFED